MGTDLRLELGLVSRLLVLVRFTGGLSVVFLVQRRVIFQQRVEQHNALVLEETVEVSVAVRGSFRAWEVMVEDKMGHGIQRYPNLRALKIFKKLK